MKKNLLLASFILLGTLLSPSAFAARKKLPPMNEYVGQLMSRMTLQEKIGQLNLMVAGDITTGSTMDTQVAGDIAAGKIVQLYIRDKVASISRPVKEQKAFRRIHLAAGESQDVSFQITPDMLKFYNADLQYVLEPGEFDIMVGSNSRDTKNGTISVK